MNKIYTDYTRELLFHIGHDRMRVTNNKMMFQIKHDGMSVIKQ